MALSREREFHGFEPIAVVDEVINVYNDCAPPPPAPLPSRRSCVALFVLRRL